MIYALAAILGAAYALGFAPFDFWPATVLAIGGLFWLSHAKRIKPALAAWCFGLGKYGLGASWVYVSIHVYGNAPPALAAFLVLLFVALLAALFCLPIGWLYARLRPTTAWGVGDVLLFSAAWVAADWLSTWLFTGFPWLLPGYAFMDTPMLAFAPLVGVLGMGALCVVVVAAAVALTRERRVGMSMVLAFPLLLALVLTQMRWAAPGETFDVALVQGNLDQASKWLPEQAVPNVRKHLRLSADHWDADVLMWPEASVTMYPQQAQGLLESLAEQGEATATNVVLGIPGADAGPDGNYSLQNLSIGLGLARGRFAKHHLVPFGEYVPFEGLLRGMIEFFDLPMSRSSPGAHNQPNLELSMGAAAMAICYEIAYPQSMRERGRDAAVLMTISNDTWFGDSIGPLQHMQIARMRAVENARWLLRATNNGVTGIVDHEGQLVDSLPQFEEGVLRGQFTVMQGRTPYSHVGHWPVLMALAGIFGVAWWGLWANRAKRS
jgi:apolipoprotein N-acyltransferase